MTPAGWYRDPYGNPGLLRWWDGSQWTQATQPLGEAQQASWDWTGAPPTWGPPSPSGPAPGQSGPGGPAWGEPGPGGPQAWGEPGAGGPAWGEPGAGGPAPQAWGEPGAGGPAPQAWGEPGAEPPRSQPREGPARGKRFRLPLLIGGGAAIVIIITVVAILFAANLFGGGNGGGKGGRSPVTATITDSRAGISYPQLGGDWRAESVTATSGMGKLGFDQGEIAPVMADFQNGQPYVASAYSGVGPATSTPLETRARAVLAALEPTAYPAHTHQDVTSASHPVDGHSGWLLKVKLTFPQAKSQGWNFRTETAAILIVDRGSGQAPAQFYVSIPDSHKRQGDLDLLLSSLKVS